MRKYEYRFSRYGEMRDRIEAKKKAEEEKETVYICVKGRKVKLEN